MANLNKVQHLIFIEDRRQDKGFNYLALYRCVCGTERIYAKKDVRAMRKTACGCMRFGENNKGGFVHGLRNHPIYHCWKNLFRRCYKKDDPDYPNYGGRGITVYAEWHNIANFVAWAEANGYDPGLELDRKENDKIYGPDNCRFVTSKVNNNNRRNNRFLELNGKRQTVQMWADELGIKSNTLRRRIDIYKWPLERALNA